MINATQWRAARTAVLTAENLGRRAREDGCGRDECPYRGECGSEWNEPHELWLRGWDSRDAELRRAADGKEIPS